MFSKHEWDTGQMRKAAIKSNGRTAVVWPTKARSLKSPEVLVCDGSNSLIQTSDKEIATRQKWLSASEYDNQTRQEVDALWEKVEKDDMWFMLGASANKHTVIAHTEGRWAVRGERRRARQRSNTLKMSY
jgi:hypothetical protein